MYYSTSRIEDVAAKFDDLVVDISEVSMFVYLAETS